MHAVSQLAGSSSPLLAKEEGVPGWPPSCKPSGNQSLGISDERPRTSGMRPSDLSSGAAHAAHPDLRSFQSEPPTPRKYPRQRNSSHATKEMQLAKSQPWEMADS